MILLQVPDTWSEFLLAAARKVNSARISSVETLDTGTVLEELDEIMHGDKLVIRCQGSAAPSTDQEESSASVGTGAQAGGRSAAVVTTGGRSRVRGRSSQADPVVGNDSLEVDDCIEV